MSTGGRNVGKLRRNTPVMVTIVAAVAVISVVLAGCGNLFGNIAGQVHKKYELTVVAGNGGDVTPAGTITVDHGESCDVDAEPDADWHFMEWTVTSGAGVNIGDANDATTTVTLTSGDGEVTAVFGEDPKPDISVTYEGSTYNSGDDADLQDGPFYPGGSYTADIEISNDGNETLNISSFNVTGTYFAQTGAAPDQTLEGSESTILEVTYEPATTGSHSATVIITSDDPDEATFVLTLDAVATDAPEPEIVVRQSTTVITRTTGEYDFGNILYDGNGGTVSSSVEFTIENPGTANLTISAVTLSSGSTSEFELNTSATSSIVAPGGGTTTFSVVFDPLARGSRAGTITITHNDTDMNPFSFIVSGAGVASEIQVSENSVNINDGGSLDYGFAYSGETIDKTFTIHNNGTSTLTLSGTPTITGVDAADFSVTTPPSTSVAAGGSTTFVVRFYVTWGDGTTSTAQVNIDHNDPDGSEDPYNITVTAQADNYQGWNNVVYTGYDSEVIIDYPNIHVVYAVSSGGIRHISSSDGGDTWGSYTIIDAGGWYPKAYFNPSNGIIYVSYRDGTDLGFARCDTDDASPTWFTTTAVAAGNPSAYHDIVASIYGSTDRAYIAYYDATDTALKCVLSTDNGTSWGTPVVVENVSTGSIRHPSITCIDQSSAYVAISYMLDQTTNSLKIAASNTAGAGFGNITLDTTVATLCGTAIACHAYGSGLIGIAYLDSGNNLSFARCTSWISNWMTPGNWLFTTAESAVDANQYMDIEMQGASGDVYIAYQDLTNYNVKLAYSDSSGASWDLKSPPQSPSCEGERPSIELSGSILALTYNENTNSQIDISISDQSGSDW